MMRQPSAVSAGDVLGGRYTLKSTEWSSALGPVWVARDSVLGRSVLVQTLAPALAENAIARRAFLKAAARTARVGHPGLLQVYDIGDAPPFAVLEHVAGGRLAERMRSGPIAPREVARITLALARGLEALHDRGMWHGSLSPENVLFDAEGRAKIFALDQSSVAPEAAETEQPRYCRPPEAEPSRAGADRYALAAIGLAMLSGKGARSLERRLQRGTQRRDAAAVEAILARAVSPDPVARPALDELVAELAPYARAVPVEPRRPRISGSDFGWLAAVAVILVLAAVAATLGVQFARDFARRADGEATDRPARPAKATPIEVSAVADFDPEGNGEERPEQTGRTIDDDPLTAWATVGYSTADPADKSGVGLVFDLGRQEAVRRVRVRSTLAGWTAEIRVADERGNEAGDYELVTSFTSGSDETVRLPNGTRARYVLLWITTLVDDGSGSPYPFRAAVADVQFFAR